MIFKGIFMRNKADHQTAPLVQKRRYHGHVQAEIAALTAQRILQAALALFEESWLDQITLEQVATRAGVTVQTIIRRFGSKEQLIAAAGQEAYARAMLRRSEAPVGDIVGAVRTMVAHYEGAGTRLLRALAQEERDAQFQAIVDAGRADHRQWVERVFAPFLATRGEHQRERLLAQLVAMTDVYSWKLLRRDAGLSREQTELAMQEMIEALCERKAER
jgi:AcrR family transcriptional regulator